MAKKCEICKEQPVCKKWFNSKTCENLDCRAKWAIKTMEKQRDTQQKKAKQDWNKEKLAIKEKLKTLSEWKSDLQIEINAIVREIDKGWGCIATKTLNGKMNAGHYISVGSNDTLRFHLENIWLQSEHSNNWKSGDTLRYQDGIVRLFGSCYLDYMNSLKSIKSINLKIEDIKEKIPIARGILKWCKLQERYFTLSERVELRKKFNKEIGIYHNKD